VLPWEVSSGVRIDQLLFSFILRDPKSGKAYPTDNMALWLNALVFQRSATHFVDPDDFIPERFLSKSSPYFNANVPESIHDIPEGAFRVFERGPRSCIGQELALIEARVVLLMTMRRFEIRAAYDEVSKVVDDGSRWKKPTGGKVLGEEAYQV